MAVTEEGSEKYKKLLDYFVERGGLVEYHNLPSFGSLRGMDAYMEGLIKVTLAYAITRKGKDLLEIIDD